MKATDNPELMPVPFALNGQRNDIPQASQISIMKGAASFNDGFPPLTMTDPLKGGIPPFGKDMNGVLYLLSLTAKWLQLGGSFTYNSAFATDPNVGGYPKGAVLLNAAGDGFWISTADDNATNPDATDGSSRNWLSVNSDWNAVSGPGAILNKPILAAVATSGNYADLSGKPTILNGVSSDAGDVLTVGSDGKPLLTQQIIQANQTVTSQEWDAVNKVLTFTNEAGVTLTVNLAAVDAHLESASLQAGVLVLHGVDGEPDVTVDLTSFLQAVQAQGSQTVTLAGAGTVSSPLQASVVLDPAAGNLLSAGPNGLLAMQVNADWNATSGPAEILNKPSMSSNLPTLIIEFGNSAQPNGGRGIDNGNYYQPDCRISTTAYNSFPYVTNSDGTVTVPPGLYLVSGCLQIIAPSTDTYQLPAQMTVAMGMVYKFPGIFQYAARVLPDEPLSTQSVSGTIGTVVISSVQNWSADWEIWTGFSKVLGSASQTPLLLQGELSVTQLCSFAPGTALTSNTARAPV